MARDTRSIMEMAWLARSVVEVHLALYVVGEQSLKNTCVGLHVAARQMAAAVDLLPLSSLKQDAYRALCIRRSLMRGW